METISNSKYEHKNSSISVIKLAQLQDRLKRSICCFYNWWRQKTCLSRIRRLPASWPPHLSINTQILISIFNVPLICVRSELKKRTGNDTRKHMIFWSSHTRWTVIASSSILHAWINPSVRLFVSVCLSSSCASFIFTLIPANPQHKRISSVFFKIIRGFMSCRL